MINQLVHTPNGTRKKERHNFQYYHLKQVTLFFHFVCELLISWSHHSSHVTNHTKAAITNYQWLSLLYVYFVFPRTHWYLQQPVRLKQCHYKDLNFGKSEQQQFFTVLQQASVSCEFLDLKPVRIQNFPTRVTVNSSEDVKLVCKVDGTPTPDLEWTKDGQQVGVCSGNVRSTDKTCRQTQGTGARYRVRWIGSGSELHVQHTMHPFDAGNFTCEAIGPTGRDSAAAEVTIQGT